MKTIKSEGVPIDGIGVQGHFQAAPDATTIKASFDILDDFGVPIKITEFDCAIDDGDGTPGDVDGTIYNTDPAIEAIEADGLETVYRIAFEHHAVAGILMWGFGKVSIGDLKVLCIILTGVYLLKAADIESLVFDEWWTDADLIARRRWNGGI